MITRAIGVLACFALGLVLAGLLHSYDKTLQHVIFEIIFAAVVMYIAWLYWRSKEVRAPLHGLLAWGCVLWAPLVTLGFLRDYWMNAWFQQTFFPAVVLPLMVLTLLGTVALSVRLGSELRTLKRT